MSWVPDEPVPMTPTRLPLKSARERGHLGDREAPGGHQAPAGGDGLACVRRDRPGARDSVEMRAVHPRVQLDVRPQLVAVGHVVEIAQQLRLRGIPLRPAPFLLEVVVERVRVVHALDVAPGPRVPVVKPGPADPGPGLEQPDGVPRSEKAVEHVETAEAGAHHDGVQRRNPGRVGCLRVHRRKPFRGAADCRLPSPVAVLEGPVGPA
jgi:hypothetical protein